MVRSEMLGGWPGGRHWTIRKQSPGRGRGVTRMAGYVFAPQTNLKRRVIDKKTGFL